MSFEFSGKSEERIGTKEVHVLTEVAGLCGTPLSLSKDLTDGELQQAILDDDPRQMTEVLLRRLIEQFPSPNQVCFQFSCFLR